MRYRKKHLFVIKKKHLKIIVTILAVILLTAVIVLVSSANRDRAEKQQAVQTVASEGIIYVGLRGDVWKLCTYNGDIGDFEGLEKDLADEIIARLFEDDIIVAFETVTSETKDARLKTGDIDIALGASYAQETKGITYTAPYYTAGSAFLVMEGRMTDELGLSGGTVAIVQGSYVAGESPEDEEKTRIDVYFESRGIDAAVRVFASYPEAIDALSSGVVDGVCANEIFLNVFGKTGMLILPERFIPEPLCIGVSGTLDGFAQSVDEVLAEMKEDGTLSALIDKWNLIDYNMLDNVLAGGSS